MVFRPKQPPSNLAASGEVQAWIARLETENRSVGRRNIVLLVALAVGVLLLILVSWGVYQSSVRSYAVLEDVVISRNPANQGRLQFSFRVVSPGKVFYRRTSGDMRTEVIDYFESPGDIQRCWSWVYEPGEDIHASLLYRGGLWRKTCAKQFPTARQADIVVLIDTTGSMSRCIEELKQKCIGFSEQLRAQSLEHRFALIGFGDTSESECVDKYDFTDDVEEFQQRVGSVKRFDGGDLPESALDAIEEALSLPFDKDAIRRFYLVTDAAFHESSASGAKVPEIVARLQQEQVLLNVFSRAEFQAAYGDLVGDCGKFQKLEDFGKVLAEGRILED